MKLQKHNSNNYHEYDFDFFSLEEVIQNILFITSILGSCFNEDRECKTTIMLQWFLYINTSHKKIHTIATATITMAAAATTSAQEEEICNTLNCTAGDGWQQMYTKRFAFPQLGAAHSSSSSSSVGSGG